MRKQRKKYRRFNKRRIEILILHKGNSVRILTVVKASKPDGVHLVQLFEKEKDSINYFSDNYEVYLDFDTAVNRAGDLSIYLINDGNYSVISDYDNKYVSKEEEQELETHCYYTSEEIQNWFEYLLNNIMCIRPIFDVISQPDGSNFFP